MLRTISIFGLLLITFSIGSLFGALMMYLTFADVLEEQVKPAPQESKGHSLMKSFYADRVARNRLTKAMREEFARISRVN